jgi:hypothetical protein
MNGETVKLNNAIPVLLSELRPSSAPAQNKRQNELYRFTSRTSVTSFIVPSAVVWNLDKYNINACNDSIYSRKKWLLYQEM